MESRYKMPFVQRKKVYFTSDEEEMLIDFVKQHDVLFNMRNKEFRNTTMKNQLWNEIGESIDKNYDDCIKKWSNIRDYYIRKKNKPGAVSSNENYTKRDDQLSFLDEVSHIKRKTTSNTDEMDSEKMAPIDDDARDGVYFVVEDYCNTMLEDNNTNYSIESDSNAPTVKRRKRKKDTCGDQLKSFEGCSEKRFKLMVERPEPPATLSSYSSIDLFFASMSQTVKTFPLKQQAIMKMKIGALVSQMELKVLGDAEEDNQTNTQLVYDEEYVTDD